MNRANSIRGPRHVGLCVSVLIVSTLALGGCTKAMTTHAVLLPAVSSATLPVQSGFDHDERFCGAVGTIYYLVANDDFTFRLHLAAVKAHRLYEIIWRNNNVRGYTVGAFSTTAAGAIRHGSVKLFRSGEVRAEGLKIDYLVDFKPEGVQNFRPC